MLGGLTKGKGQVGLKWKNEKGLIIVTHKIRLIRISLKSANFSIQEKKILKETEEYLKSDGLKGFGGLNSNKYNLLDYYLKISKNRINLGINQPMGQNATTFACGKEKAGGQLGQQAITAGSLGFLGSSSREFRGEGEAGFTLLRRASIC